MTLDIATLRITPEILSLIAEIDEFKGAWRAIGRIAPERLSGLRRVATIESIGSSTRIEGAKLSDREVEKLLANIQLGSFTTKRSRCFGFDLFDFSASLRAMSRRSPAMPR